MSTDEGEDWEVEAGGMLMLMLGGGGEEDGIMGAPTPAAACNAVKNCCDGMDWIGLVGAAQKATKPFW